LPTVPSFPRVLSTSLFLSRPLSRSGRSSSSPLLDCHPSYGALTASNPSYPHCRFGGISIKTAASSTCPSPFPCSRASLPCCPSPSLPGIGNNDGGCIHLAYTRSSLHRAGPVLHPPLFLHPGPVTRPPFLRHHPLSHRARQMPTLLHHSFLVGSRASRRDQ
jgi:hypothetical protein